MKLKSSLAALTAVALFAAAPASATDLGGSKDSTNYSYTPDKVNWTGLYIGVQGGIGDTNTKLDVTGYCEAGNKCNGGVAKSDNLFSLDGINSNGFIGGGSVGFDKQMGKIVIGVFGDYNFSNVDTSASIDNGFGTAKIEKNDQWSAGIRAGYLLSPKTMVYGLVGYAQADYKFSASFGSESGSKDITFKGVVAGGGLETAIAPNLFLGAEYRHLFLDGENLYDSGPNVCGRGILVDVNPDEDQFLATLKVKLNSDIGKILE